MVFGQGGLEICRGEMIWPSLVGTPFHEKAITEAHSENQHSVMVTDPAAVVVVGDIQALMQTASQCPRRPGSDVASFRRPGARAPGCLSASPVHLCGLRLTQQQGSLLGQWEADLFGADWCGNNTAAFFAALVDFLRISLSRRWLLRGKKPAAQR